MIQITEKKGKLYIRIILWRKNFAADKFPAQMPKSPYLGNLGAQLLQSFHKNEVTQVT